MAGLRRMLDVIILTVAGFVVAIALRGGGSIDLFGVHVSANTLYTPMLALTILVLARAALTTRPRLSLRRERSMIAAWRMVAAAGALVMLAMLSPALYALGDHVLSGKPTCPPLWRSSPAGIDLAGLRAAEPEPRALGRRDAGAARPLDGPRRRLPRGGRLAVAGRLAVIAGGWWRAGWQVSRIRVGVTIFFALLTLGPFLQVAGLNTQIPLPWSVLRYVPVLGLVRSPAASRCW